MKQKRLTCYRATVWHSVWGEIFI